MTAHYKPLTPIKLLEIYNDAHADKMEALVAIERAAIENYLAQREPADAWLLTLRSLLNDLIAHAQANGLEIARAGDVLESTAQVGFRLAGILEHAKRFVSTPPAPQDAQVGKDAERYRALAWAMETNDKDARRVLNKYLEPTPSRETVGKIADELIAIAAAKGKE